MIKKIIKTSQKNRRSDIIDILNLKKIFISINRFLLNESASIEIEALTNLRRIQMKEKR
jgi:hypothetical protein